MKMRMRIRRANAFWILLLSSFVASSGWNEALALPQSASSPEWVLICRPTMIGGDEICQWENI